jgi:hypothetical protein
MANPWYISHIFQTDNIDDKDPESTYGEEMDNYLNSLTNKWDTVKIVSTNMSVIEHNGKLLYTVLVTYEVDTFENTND